KPQRRQAGPLGIDLAGRQRGRDEPSAHLVPRDSRDCSMIQGYPHQAARRLIASYPTYAQAQRAVDMLSDQSFPVEHVSIVADGLSIVEQVTGRLGWGKSMVNGAIAGAATGALIGFIW